MKLIATAILLWLAQNAHAEGYEAWKFGMSRDDVRAVAAHAPYYVLPNNDLGSQSGPIEGIEVPISFYFYADALSRIMLITYQGEDLQKVKDAWALSIRHLEQRFGGVELGSNKGVVATSADAITTLESQVGTMTPGARMQVGAFPMPSDTQVWATVVRATETVFMVAVNYAPR